MSREMKDSGIEWIGKILKNWEVKPLKQVLAERKEMNDPIKTNYILSLTVDKGVIPYDKKTGGGNKSKEDLTAYKLAYPNDIVLNSMNVIVGSVGLSKYFGCVSPVYYVLYPRAEYYDINYYNNIFKSSEFQKSLVGLGNGIMIKESDNGKLNTIRMRIPMGKLNLVGIPVPPIVQQKKIADFLDERISEIDNIISQITLSIEEYKKYKQSLITEAVTKGLNPNVEMKDSGVEWIGMIPLDWNIQKLKYVAKLSPKCNTEHLNQDSEVTFLPMECIKNGYFINRSAKFSGNNSSYNQFENEDIVIAKVTPCFENGNIAIMKDLYNGYGFGSSELFVLRCNDKIYNKFLFYYLQNTMFVNIGISTMTGTGGLKRVSSDFMKNNKIAVTSIEEQQQIADYLDKKCSEIDSIIAQKQQLLAELESYKKSLIYECVTGKIEVK